MAGDEDVAEDTDRAEYEAANVRAVIVAATGVVLKAKVIGVHGDQEDFEDEHNERSGGFLGASCGPHALWSEDQENALNGDEHQHVPAGHGGHVVAEVERSADDRRVVLRNDVEGEHGPVVGHGEGEAEKVADGDGAEEELGTEAFDVQVVHREEGQNVANDADERENSDQHRHH